jgi:transposase
VIYVTSLKLIVLSILFSTIRCMIYESRSIDLWKGYKTLAERIMPNAQVVADRFHVMMQVNQELDGQRKREKRQADNSVETAKFSQEKNKSKSTILRWLDEVISYFDHRTTNGVVEGINNKIKLIKRAAYGFRNFENFQARCWLHWHFNC